MPVMAAAPARPWRAPERRAEVNESFLQSKPAKRENSAEVPSMQSRRPQPVRKSRKKAATQSKRAKIKETFRGEGSKIEGSLVASGIKAVARRVSLLLLAGPLIKPSIKGMIAEDAIKEVKRKSALRRILNTAERPASRAEEAAAAASASKTAKAGGSPLFPKAASITALTKPPR